MKKLFSFLLMLTIGFSMVACENPYGPNQPAPGMDTTGKYKLDTIRNEAIIHDAGTITAENIGNARVYYQIFVGSFSDYNGDGIGDIRGIIDRMDYLNDGDPNSGLSLGIEGIWLTPIFDSPSYHKYDTTDYYMLDPSFGTEADLKELIDLCHERGVQIILDLVINHTSTQHAWFQKFQRAHRDGDTESKYYDYYTYADAPLSGRTFQTISGSDHYYECNFSGDMPELNYDNEAVRQEMVNVAKYYLDLGVDGFRFDAAKYVYYGDESRNAEFWQWYMQQLRQIKPDIYTVAEVWDAEAVTYNYIPYTNCFNFAMSQSGGKVDAAAKGNVNAYTSYIESYLNTIHALNPDAMLMTFITNHDMDRAAGFLTVASGRAYIAANLSILTPGSPYIYYGEEIALKGSRGGSNTDANRRLAMLWGDYDSVLDPIGANYKGVQSDGTVKDQLSNGDSLYNHYKKLIMLRKANPEIAYGTYQALSLKGTTAGGFLSTYEGKTVCVLHNASTEKTQVDLSQLDVDLSTLAGFAGMGGATLEGTILTLDAQTSAILR